MAVAMRQIVQLGGLQALAARRLRGGGALIALLVQMIGAYVVTPAWSAYGPVGLVMPAVLLAIALFLLWYANKAQARSWLS